jgi:hypothetical protein
MRKRVDDKIVQNPPEPPAIGNCREPCARGDEADTLLQCSNVVCRPDILNQRVQTENSLLRTKLGDTDTHVVQRALKQRDKILNRGFGRSHKRDIVFLRQTRSESAQGRRSGTEGLPHILA